MPLGFGMNRLFKLRYSRKYSHENHRTLSGGSQEELGAYKVQTVLFGYVEIEVLFLSCLFY